MINGSTSLPHSILTIDGKPSTDFSMYLSGGGTYSSPEKAHNEIEVPGRNGSIIIPEGHFKNVTVSYEAFIYRDVRTNFANLRSFLMSRNGYVRLEDTYHPDEFRLGSYLEAIEPTMSQDLQVAEFTLNFNCKPQRFLKAYYDGDPITATSGTVIKNPTYFSSKPLIRAYGAGTLTIGSVSVRITSSSGYTDLDCELQEAYYNTLANSRNSNIVLTNGVFPELVSGNNTVTLSGISRLEITPRYFNL